MERTNQRGWLDIVTSAQPEPPFGWNKNSCQKGINTMTAPICCRRILWLYLLLECVYVLPTLAFVSSGQVSRSHSCRRQGMPTRSDPEQKWFFWHCNYSNQPHGDHHHHHHYDAFSSNNSNPLDPLLRSRIDELKKQTLEKTYRMTPNPNLSAIETVSEVLNSLYSCDDPSPDAGIRSLLRTSTLRWKQLLYESVGASRPQHVLKEESHVVSALRSSMERPNNQFRILVEDDDPQEAYYIVFPSEPVDYMDGTCWVECQLRRRTDSTLLITMGWQLVKEHGCWMIDHIDWQDFRDAFRPGIGREEWMRICG